MKLNTLARRLAEKTGHPILEDILLGNLPISEMPEGCMVWTGAKTRPGREHKPRIRRDGKGWLCPVLEEQRPQAIIRYQKKTHLVRRLIFSILMKPDYEFRMVRTCQGHDLCVNILHYTIEPIALEPPTPPTPSVDEGGPPEMSEDWTEDEVRELLEIVLDRGGVEVLDDPLLFDAPPKMVREQLIAMGKEHILS